ncbi:VMO1 protein, partial [Polypterus senegalus]
MFTNRQYYSTINVTNGGEFGKWTWSEICPEDFYAIGYSLRVEAYQVGGDDTALNGIRLYCSRLNDRSILYTVESHTGLFGDWTQTLWCPSGVLKSFQLRVEPYQGILDDTAANNIKFRCSSSPVLEGFGQTFGDYGKWSDECKEGGICGIETKQEPYQANERLRQEVQLELRQVLGKIEERIQENSVKLSTLTDQLEDLKETFTNRIEMTEHLAASAEEKQ